jgi:phage FluMu protein Com
MTAPISFRCASCRRRLADYANAIERGQVTIAVKCKCGTINSLLLSTTEAPEARYPERPVSATRV